MSCSVIVSFFSIGSIVSARMFSFSGALENIRVTFLIDFFYNIHSLPVYGYYWTDFLQYSTHGFAYPHNLFAELLYYFGAFGFFLSLLVMYVAFLSVKAFNRNIRLKLNSIDNIYIILFLTLLISSLFSGDLSDNFTVISLAVYGFFNFRKYFFKVERC